MATAELTQGSVGQFFEPGVAVLPDDLGTVEPQVMMSDRPEANPSHRKLLVQVVPYEGRSAVPTHVEFGAFRDIEFRLKKPIPLEVSREENTIIVSWVETAEFATGETLTAAMDDFSRGLSELYRELFAPNVRLGSDLMQVRESLGKYIERRK